MPTILFVLTFVVAGGAWATLCRRAKVEAFASYSFMWFLGSLGVMVAWAHTHKLMTTFDFLQGVVGVVILPTLIIMVGLGLLPVRKRAVAGRS